jgi:flavin reductase (DIM6/NTAB) family NADH-FMN oxidoreductase RutF
MRITDATNPLQTILLTCRADSKDNIITLDWHMPLSFEPMMFAVSIGKTRYSLEMVRKSKVFVANFMGHNSESGVLFCGRNSGRNVDKFALCGLKKEEAKTIDCPRIAEAQAYLECEVEREIEFGDHILFVGKVTHAEVKSEGKRLFHLTADKFTTTVD